MKLLGSHRMVLHSKTLGMPLIVTAGFDSFRKPIDLPAHQHPGYELTYIEEGEVTWNLENKKPLHLNGGEIALTLPNQKHSGEWNIIRPCTLYWIVFNPSASHAAHHTSLSRKDLEYLDRKFKAIGNRVASVNATLRELFGIFLSILQSFQKSHSLSTIRLRMMLVQMILEALLCYEKRQKPSKIEWIGSICRWINENLEKDISVADLAAQACLSANKFTDLFKKQVGLTPADYLSRARCAKARDLMIKTDESITEIALRLCFSSSQYFATCFKKYTGLTPSAFRDQAQAKAR